MRKIVMQRNEVLAEMPRNDRKHLGLSFAQHDQIKISHKILVESLTFEECGGLSRVLKSFNLKDSENLASLKAF